MAKKPNETTEEEVKEEEVQTESTTTTTTEEVKEEEEEAESSDSTTIADAIKADFEQKQKELEERLAALEAEKAEAIKRAEEAEKGLADQKAADAIAKAVQDGKLTPAQVGEGSVFVELAHKDPELFERIVAELHGADFPVKAKLSQDEVAEMNKQGSKSYKELIASGKDPMAAFDEVSK